MSSKQHDQLAAIDITTLKESSSAVSLGNDKCHSQCFDPAGDAATPANLTRAAINAGVNISILSDPETSRKCCSCRLCCYCVCMRQCCCSGQEKKKKPAAALDEALEESKLSKRVKLNYLAMCIFAFLTGSDFAVILPTLWDRLNDDYGASGSFMGLVMSSYSFTGVICGLIMGKLSDTTKKTKPFLLIASVFSIIGHLLYFVGINKFVLLLARAISGLGLGASTCAISYVARTTTAKQRTSVISIIMACRQLGLMFGPAFNLFLRKSNFYLFQFKVDRKSSPGLLMAFLWLLCGILLFIIYQEDKPTDQQVTAQAVDDNELGKKSEDSDENTKFIEKSKEAESPNGIGKAGKNQYSVYREQFLRLEILALLAITFFTYFNQTSLETIVTPFTEIMFGWSELENSILFCIGGTVIILSYVGIRVFGTWLKDRTILLIGIMTILTGLVIACVFLPFASQLKDPNIGLRLYRSRHSQNNSTSIKPAKILISNSSHIFNMPYLNQTDLSANSTGNSTQPIEYDFTLFPVFVLFVTLDVLGLPAIAICSASLFTKLIDNDVQGIGQGIQRGTLGLGTIFGPLLAGPFVTKPIILLSITLGFIFFIFLLVIFSFKRLKKS